MKDNRGRMESQETGGRGLDRRSFLTTVAGGAAAAVAAPALLSACAKSDAPTAAPSGSAATSTSGTQLKARRGGSLLDVPAAQSPIKHVVVLMMENRSFDHWLGWLSMDEQWLASGRGRYGSDFTVEAKQVQTFPGPNGPVTTSHMMDMLAGGNPYRGCDHPDPGHGWAQGRAERDGGFLSHDSGNDQFALGYYQGIDLPITSQLAKRFTVCDQSFASVLGPTYPNREYFLSAQSGGNRNNNLPTDLATGFQWDTIVDRLAKANVSFKSYYTDLPVLGLFGGRTLPYLHKVDDFFTDAKAGQLPSVSFVDPGFNTGTRTDNHPHGDIRAGEAFVRDVFAAFAASPNWSEGAFILTYDEWGGFFEHVKPPILPDDRTNNDDMMNFAQAGFRVPTIVASPFAQNGFVDHQQYDHTSILRFLEWRFLGAPPTGNGGDSGWSLTTRDRNANNIGSSLVIEPDKDLGFDPKVTIDPPSPDCPAGASEGLWSAPPAIVPMEGDKHAFELAKEAGLFEAMGANTDPSSMVKDWAF